MLSEHSADIFLTVFNVFLTTVHWTIKFWGKSKDYFLIYIGKNLNPILKSLTLHLLKFTCG